MHHSEATGDSPGTRKMAHTSVFASRRGSNTGSVGLTASSNSASINCNAIPTDDHQSSLIMHHTPPTGSSSPGPLHPPHSLNMHAQPQTLQSAGAQVKKKSGFQITSVLPAQVSASTNNSIADDTESYDDMDESHTEDLSSSDILDVSVSRATDTGIPERSSSEETLNSLHGGETPGVTSPNEPVMHHSQSTQQGYMVNGTVHHHGHHHHSHQPHGHHKDQGIPTAAAQPVQGVAVSSASVASAVSATAGPATSAATVPGRTQKAPSVRGAVEVGAPGILNQPISTVSSSTSGGTGAAGMAGGVVGTLSVGASLPGTTGLTGVTITGIAVAPVQLPPASSSGQTQATAASTATASRFRVVKLDSSSEPFKKGRWMCTEYYEKESLAAAPCSEAPAPHRAVESVIQSESESTSGSSSSSMMSTDQGTQQVFAPITAPGPHPGLPQTMTQLHALAQDPGAHSVGPGNPQLVSVTGLLGTEGQPPVVRPQQQVPYTLEGQAGQVHSSYALNQKPSVLGNQGLQSMDYASISQGMQAPPQPHQVPQLQGSVAPRVTPVPTQISSLPIGNPVAVSQAVSSRPQVSAPQMVLTQGHTLSQAPQHPSQKPTDQQQTALSQPPLPSSSTPGQTAASILSSTLKNSLQPGLPQTLQQASAVAAQSGGLGLALRHQGGQSSQLAQPGGPYGGMPPLTASQLEDAGRLLFQHQSLLSLPRLGAGGVAGLIGQSASEPGAILAQDGSGEAGALATSVATDEDSSSGAGVVAIDNKIEQAMDLVKSHLMYAVREEVEVLKEQIKELIERNSQLEQENSLLKTLASPEQLAQFQAQVQTSSPTSSTQPGAPGVPALPLQGLAPSQGMGPPV